MRQLSEFALTNLASVRFDAQVDPRVLWEVGGVGESFATACTLVRFWFSKMDLGVQLEVRFGGKRLWINCLDLVSEAYEAEQTSGIDGRDIIGVGGGGMVISKMLLNTLSIPRS